MVLVFLLFGFSILIALIFYILLLSNIKVKITKLHIFYNKKKLDITFVSKLSLYLFNKVRLFQITIDDDKIKDLYKSGKIDVNKLKNNKELNKLMLKSLKNIDFTVEELKLKGYIGTEDAAFTAITAGIINIIIPIILMNRVKKYAKDKFSYGLETVYVNQNIVNLEFNCIISVKIVHIINMIYILLKKGRVKKNERTSNRRTYAYSHE